MIVIDANLLIYSYNIQSAHHAKSYCVAREHILWPRVVGLPWQAISAFLRVMTNRKLPGERVELEDAVQAVEEWLQAPNVQILIPGDQHWRLFRRMMIEGRASGPLVSDAVIAALTIEYGGVLHTADRDFARFPGLRWMNPLASDVCPLPLAVRREQKRYFAAIAEPLKTGRSLAGAERLEKRPDVSPSFATQNPFELQRANLYYPLIPLSQTQF